MSRVMFSLLKAVVGQMRAMIPLGERSQVMAKLLIQEIEQRESKLFLAAEELESSTGLQKEMEIWDSAFGNDGLDDVYKPFTANPI